MSKQSTKNNTSGKKRPENKDDLDSRKKEEQIFKGDDVTHNKKAKRRKRESGKN